MATIYTCTEPEEAWQLVSHFLANLLQVIMSNSELMDVPQTETELDYRKNSIDRNRAQLIGVLYVLARKMSNGYSDDAAKIQQILDMVVEQDVTNAEVRKAIFAKHEEFDANARHFKATMEKLRAEFVR